jgi:hypothetical protein
MRGWKVVFVRSIQRASVVRFARQIKHDRLIIRRAVRRALRPAAEQFAQPDGRLDFVTARFINRTADAVAQTGGNG